MGTFNYTYTRIEEGTMARKKPEPEVEVVPKRIGGSLAVFLPADFVRREGIREGQPVRLLLKEKGRHPALGLLKHIPYEPFDRHEGEAEDDG